MGYHDFNITIDNISPLLTFAPSGVWREGNTRDGTIVNYHDTSFTVTQTKDASCTFTFHGNAIWIYGGTRKNHGVYDVSLDGDTTTRDGHHDPDLYQQVLYSATGLSNTNHTVIITDASDAVEANYLDIDFLVYQKQVEDGSQDFTQSHDDSAFKYTGNWNSDNGHSTIAAGDYVKFAFTQGSAAQIWGNAGRDYATYSVRVDNGILQQFNATRAPESFDTMLYEINSLPEGPHTVIMTNQPDANGQIFSISHAIVTYSQNLKSTLGAGLIGGIVAGVVVFIIALLAVVFLIYQRQKSNAGVYDLGTPPMTEDDHRNNNNDHLSGSGWADPFSSPYRPSTMQFRHSGMIQGADSSSELQYHPLPGTPLRHESSGETMSLVRAEPGRRNDSPQNTLSSGSYQMIHPYQVSAADGPLVTRSLPTSALPKGARAHRPRPSNETLIHIPQEQLQASRMRVDGRPQDFGAVPDEVLSSDLPPNYIQAIEPFRPAPVHTSI